MKKIVTLIAVITIIALTTIVWATITTTSTRVTYSCNGSTKTFSFTFPIIETNDLVVIKRLTSTGAETVLTETTNYTVTATNNDFSSGGTVTTVGTALASTYTLTIMRATDLTQGTDLEDSGVLRLEALEDELDKLTMIVQEQQEVLNRCLKYPKTDSTSLSSELPNSVDRASKTLAFTSGSIPTAK